MKCPNCGSDKIFQCTDKTMRKSIEYLFWLECVECNNKSETVDIPIFKKNGIEYADTKLIKKWE